MHASHVSNGPRISTHLNHCTKLQLQRTRPHLYPRYVGRNSYKTLGCRRYGKRQRATKDGNQPLLLNRKNLAESLQLLYVHAILCCGGVPASMFCSVLLKRELPKTVPQGCGCTVGYYMQSVLSFYCLATDA